MSLDLSNLSTEKGTKIVLHFEKEMLHTLLEERYTREKLENKLRADIRAVDDGIHDTGLGTKIHILFNTEGKAVFLSEQEFAKWEKDPPDSRNWYHSRPDPADFLAFLSAALKPSSQQFTGSTPEKIREYSSNPITVKIIERATKNENCALCPAPSFVCHFRSASFDEPAFQNEIAKQTAKN